MTVSESRHCPDESRSERPETPTNQSGEGAIIDVSVMRGWSLVKAMPEYVREPTTPGVLREMDRSALGIAASTSLFSVSVPPLSAMDSTPALATAPGARKTASSLCMPPTQVVKCGFFGTPSGVTPASQLPEICRL